MKFLAHIGCGLMNKENMIFILREACLGINGFGIKVMFVLFIEDAIKVALCK